MTKVDVIVAVAAVLLVLLPRAWRASESRPARQVLALSTSNATPCTLAFEVSSKVLGAAIRNGAFPSTAGIR
jgi:hypothetical protein